MDRIEVIAVRFLFYHILPGNTDILPHAHTHTHTRIPTYKSKFTLQRTEIRTEV